MKLRIVKRYKDPCYPTRQYLMEHPELLRWIPERWRKHRLVLSVVSMVIPLIVPRPTFAGDAETAPATTSHVAPLFIHGDGRGSFGCVAVNPPVFLSEDEARQVIQDEAKKAGITFSAEALTLKDIEVPITDQFGFLDRMGKEEKDAPEKPKSQKLDLVLDGYDKELDVAYHVVTKKDFADWEKKDRTGWCSVSSYDFKATAQVLTNGLTNAKEKTTMAVFYEPAAHPPRMEYPKKDATDAERRAFWEESEKAAKEMGKKELQQQVQDFVKWLKGQGVI